MSLQYIHQDIMSPTMTLIFSPQSGPPSPSPAPVLSSNSTGSSSVLSANAAQSVMIGETFSSRLPHMCLT